MIDSSQSGLAEVLRKRDLVTLREILKNWSPSALVQLMTELAPDDQMIVLRILHRELADEAFESLNLPEQERLLKAMGTRGAGSLTE